VVAGSDFGKGKEGDLEDRRCKWRIIERVVIIEIEKGMSPSAHSTKVLWRGEAGTPPLTFMYLMGWNIWSISPGWVHHHQKHHTHTRGKLGTREE